MDHKNNNYLASAINSDSADIMNGPLIPTQSANSVMPSIPSMPNNILHTSAQTTVKERDDSRDRKEVRDSIACSNADFDLSIAGFPISWAVMRKMVLLHNVLACLLIALKTK